MAACSLIASGKTSPVVAGFHAERFFRPSLRSSGSADDLDDRTSVAIAKGGLPDFSEMAGSLSLIHI